MARLLRALTAALVCGSAFAQAVEPQSAFAAAASETTSYTLLHRLARRWDVEGGDVGAWQRRGAIVDGKLEATSDVASLSGSPVQRLDVYELSIEGLEDRLSAGVPVVRAQSDALGSSRSAACTPSPTAR